MNMPTRFLILPVLLTLLGCRQVTPREATALVARYNEVVSQAYRNNDIRLIDAVVGPDTPDGRRLTGLIGARLDMGLVLDAHLDSLELLGVEQAKDVLRIRTRERWSYRDLRAGTQDQVGEASVDHYEMLYLFGKYKGQWLVSETRFAVPPQVGRKEVPWSMDAKDAHAMISGTPDRGGKP